MFHYCRLYASSFAFVSDTGNVELVFFALTLIRFKSSKHTLPEQPIARKHRKRAARTRTSRKRHRIFSLVVRQLVNLYWMTIDG